MFSSEMMFKQPFVFICLITVFKTCFRYISMYDNLSIFEKKKKTKTKNIPIQKTKEQKKKN